MQKTSHLRPHHVEDFVRWLRSVQVAPNGHPKARKRPLLDKGILFILETCRAMVHYGQKRRNFPPYSENPFHSDQLGRVPVENVKAILLPNADQQRAFLEACDDWQFPVFLTLMLTGMRPGELVHLMIEDVDLEARTLRVRNRPQLGWLVKTRNEREIPLVTELNAILRRHIGVRTCGPVFLRRRFASTDPTLKVDARHAEMELLRRVRKFEVATSTAISRAERSQLSAKLWVDMGIVKIDRVRTEFMRLMAQIGLPEITAPKTFRHLFATTLQDGNVDPLIRNELMGHSPANSRFGQSLGMTANYTHTKPETRRRQLEEALRNTPAIEIAKEHL